MSANASTADLHRRHAINEPSIPTAARNSQTLNDCSVFELPSRVPPPSPTRNVLATTMSVQSQGDAELPQEVPAPAVESQPLRRALRPGGNCSTSRGSSPPRDTDDFRYSGTVCGRDSLIICQQSATTLQKSEDPNASIRGSSNSTQDERVYGPPTEARIHSPILDISQDMQALAGKPPLVVAESAASQPQVAKRRSSRFKSQGRATGEELDDDEYVRTRKRRKVASSCKIPDVQPHRGRSLKPVVCAKRIVAMRLSFESDPFQVVRCPNPLPLRTMKSGCFPMQSSRAFGRMAW